MTMRRTPKLQLVDYIIIMVFGGIFFLACMTAANGEKSEGRRERVLGHQYLFKHSTGDPVVVHLPECDKCAKAKTYEKSK